MIPKYTLRYAPLLILALLLVFLHFSMAGNANQAGQNAKNPGSSSGGTSSSVLTSIATLPDGDAWAVGGSFSTQGTPGSLPIPASGIILHYTNNAWLPARVTELLKLPLLSVSLDSSRDGWAVGWGGTLVHYDGNVWSTSSGPTNFKQNLLGVTMLSATDGWAVGYSGAILHYDGKRWTQQSNPVTVDLRGVAFPSPTEGWAVGDSGTILHYHNGAWSLIKPAPTSSTLKSVSMFSPDEGWAVGNQGTILHYRDGSWESVHPASYYQNQASYQAIDFAGVAMNSIRSGWIASDQHLLAYRSEAWIESENITDPSTGLTLHNLNLTAITMSPTGEGWAVGTIESDSTKTYSSASVILHYQANKWEVSFITKLG